LGVFSRHTVTNVVNQAVKKVKPVTFAVTNRHRPVTSQPVRRLILPVKTGDGQENGLEKSVEKEENRKEDPRCLWARNQMGNPGWNKGHPFPPVKIFCGWKQPFFRRKEMYEN
jgi:hypothetical protein